MVLSGRTAETLDAAVADLGDAAVAVVADNADPGTPARLVDTARERWGRLDGALISVGGPPTGPVTAMTDEDWTEAFESVFLGAVRLGREIGDALGEGGSLALVLSSVRSPLADLAISNGLRPGLAMVAKNLADELGPRGVRVNGLLPGRVGTERVAELDASTGDAAAARAAARNPARPLRRAGGVRPGGGVPALAGVLVRHRRDAPGRRRHAPHALTPGRRSSAPPRRGRRPAAAPLVVRQVAEPEDGQQPEEPPLQPVEEVRAVAQVGQLGGLQRPARARALRASRRNRRTSRPMAGPISALEIDRVERSVTAASRRSRRRVRSR